MCFPGIAEFPGVSVCDFPEYLFRLCKGVSFTIYPFFKKRRLVRLLFERTTLKSGIKDTT